MFEIPSPTHGFFRVVLAFWAYLGVVFGLTIVLRELGVPDNLGLLLFIVVGLLLFPVFVPLFKRLMPDALGGE